MTAAEARSLAQNPAIVETEMSRIIFHIRDRANDGYLTTTYRFITAPNSCTIERVMDILRTKGYSVYLNSDQRDGDYLSISWEYTPV